MGKLDYFIADLALMLIVAGIIILIFKKLKLPIVLGYIVAGFLISPNFKWIQTVIDEENIHLWANIGIVFLMFALGLEFSFKKIASVGGSAIITALTVMCAMIGVGYVTGSLMGWGHMDSLFLGGMLSMSSTMIILKAYEEYNLKKEKFATLVLGTLVLEDLGGIFMMIILSTVAVGQSGSDNVLFDILKLMGFLCIWVAVGIYLIPSFLKHMSKLLNGEVLLIVSLAICFGMVLLGVKIGFSSALGAFLAGSILAGTMHSTRIEKLITPFKDLFGAVFFISVGMMLVPSMILEYIWPIVITTLVTIFGQMLFSTIGMLLSGQSLHTAVRGGFSMVQIGEFSFIVATLGSSLGVTSDFIYPVVVCVSVITSFTTPLFIKNSERAYNGIRKILPKKLLKFLSRYTSEQRSSKDKDKDWKKYLVAYMERVIFCSAGLGALYLLGVRFLDPFIKGYIQNIWADIITVILIGGAMTPIIAVMCSNKNVIFTKLWIKSRSNRLPLIALNGFCICIAALFVGFTIEKLLHLPNLIIILMALAVIIFTIKTEFIESTAIKIEMRFVGNLNEKFLARQKKERGIDRNYRWLDEKMYLIEFSIKDTIENNNIVDFGNNRFYHVTIIKIIRNGKSIVMPGPMEKILEGDILHALGTKEEIEACVMMLEKEHHINDPQEEAVTLREYIYGQVFQEVPPGEQIICAPVLVERDSVLNKKAIKNSQFRQRYKGYIIGIERETMDIVNPDLNTVISEGDLLWAVGSQRMADRLLKAGIWDVEDRKRIRRKIVNRGR